MDKRYISLKNISNQKRIPLSITNDQYISIIENSVCHYCNGSLPKVGYGLDRKYSNEGYNIDNVVPCCSSCNTEKGTIPYDEYMLIWESRNKKNNNNLYKYVEIFSDFNCLVKNDHLLFDNWFKVYIRNVSDRPLIATESSISFYNDEISSKIDIIKSIINNKLNKTIKIYARKCVIGIPSISDIKEFLNNNHLKGYHNSSGYGLYYNNELVFVVTIKVFSEEIELYRVATKTNYVVIGGLSKVISKIENDYDMSLYTIISYVDRRYHTGSGYTKCNFKYVGFTDGYFYTDGKNRYNRLMGRAQNGMTELEYTTSKGWKKVIDSGQAKFVKTESSRSGYENIVKYCYDNKLELLSSKEEYVGSGRHKYVFVKPECGHVFKRSRSKLYKSITCPICKGTGNSRVHDRVDIIAKKYDLVINNKENIKSKNDIMTGICSNNHNFSREYRFIRDFGCPVCFGLSGSSNAALGGKPEDRKKAVFDNIINHCNITKQKCLTPLDTFMKASGPSSNIQLEIQCSSGHIRKVSWYTLKYYGCSVCSKLSIKNRFAEKPKTSYASKEDYQIKQRKSTYDIVDNYVKSIGGEIVTTFEEFNVLCTKKVVKKVLVNGIESTVEKTIKNSAIAIEYLINGEKLKIRRGKIKK